MLMLIFGGLARFDNCSPEFWATIHFSVPLTSDKVQVSSDPKHLMDIGTFIANWAALIDFQSALLRSGLPAVTLPC